MAWDIKRPVPWQRLMREWLIYAAIMSAVFLLIFKDGNQIGSIAGVLISGPLYLGFGWLLAKFGYQRKTLKDLRTPQAEANPKKTADDESSSGRRPVAPTSRTAGGTNRPASKKRRR